MATIEIQNWKDLREQFGIKKVDSLKCAPQIHKELKEKAEAENCPEYVCIECNDNSEAIAIFHLVEAVKQGEPPLQVNGKTIKAVYEYQGTAN